MCMHADKKSRTDAGLNLSTECSHGLLHLREPERLNFCAAVAAWLDAC